MKEGSILKSDIKFDYIEDFADYVVDRVESDEEVFLTIVGKFNEIKYIIKEIMTVSDVDFENIDLCSPNIDNYTGEYVLDCWNNDGILEIGCEPIIKDGKYLNMVSEETYLLDNCSADIIALCEETDLYFVSIEDEDEDVCECNEECCGKCCCDCEDEDEDKDSHGFEIDIETDRGYSKFTYYSSAPVNKTDIKNILRELGF